MSRAVLVLLALSGIWTSHGKAATPSLIYTRQTRFAIPFRIESPQNAAQVPVEVELHVSRDRGATWNIEGRAKPESSSFSYQVAADGEYWFAVRTVSRNGQRRPNDVPQPELCVVVDTQPPKLELKAWQGPSGEIVATWQGADLHMKPDSFHLQFQPAGSKDDWQSVAVDTMAPATPGALSGKVSWWPTDGGAEWIVQADVADEAGNRTVTEMRTGSPRATQTATAPRAQTPQWNPRVEPQGMGPTGRWPADRQVSTPLEQQGPNAEELPAPPGQRRPRTTTTGGRGVRETIDEEIQTPVPQERRGAPRTASNRYAPTYGEGESPAEELGPPIPESRNPWTDEGPVFEQGPATGAEYPTETTDPGEPAPQPTDTTGRRRALNLSLLPSGEQPRMVNSRRFELEYEVESVGSSGIAKVELWGTRDGGRQWSIFAVDDDNRSPMLIAVDGEGIYGFRMVIKSGNGLGGLPPESGDLPDLWVGVDLTKPYARIISAVQGSGELANELTITWESHDDLLAARPITLSFSDQPGGPWVTIAAGLENSAQYVWQLDNRVPDRLFLRIEACDEAGNVQAVDSREPVVLDRIRPEGRIRDVRPARDSRRGS